MTDTGGAFAVQAACMFLAVGWTARLARLPLSDGRAMTARGESFAHSIVEGWKFSWHNEAVRAGLLTTAIVCALMFPFVTLLPVFARDLLEVGAEGQGFLLAAMGVGALLSAAAIALAGHRLTRGRVMIDSSIVYGLALVVFAASPWFSLSLVAMGVAGLCHVHANALVHTVVQSHSPPAYRGRTMALFNMGQLLSTAGGMFIGLLAFVLGSRGAVATMGAAGALAILILVWRMPRARQIK
jgi:predicted MFS family arabinose efflux permease